MRRLLAPVVLFAGSLAHADAQPGTSAGGGGGSTLPAHPADAPRGIVRFDAEEVPSLRVTAVGTSERRDSGGGSTLSVNVAVVSDGLSVHGAIRRVIATNAADDRGRTVSILAPSPSNAGPVRLSAGPVNRTSLGASIRLESPARTAHALRFVEGVVEVFVPSEVTGSAVRIPRVVSQSGFVRHPLLARHGIEFRFLGDASSYAAARSEISATPGATPVIGSPTVPGPSLGFPKAAGFYVRDAGNRYAGHLLLNPDGTVLVPPSESFHGSPALGFSGQIELAAPLSPDSQLVIFLEVPEAVKRIPFRIEDVPLP